MPDITIEEAERRRIAFANRRGQRGAAGKYAAGSVFVGQGGGEGASDQRAHVLKIAKLNLEAQADMRETQSIAESVKTATTASLNFAVSSRKHRRCMLWGSAVLPCIHRACSVGVLVQLVFFEWYRWAGVGLFVLFCASLAEGWLVARQEIARRKAMPKPEMTKDAEGQQVPRTMHDCHCPYAILVEVEAARDLTAMDFSLTHGGTSDPYVIIKLLARVRARKKDTWKWIELDRRRTKTIDKDLSPHWGAVFEFSNERKFGSTALKLEFEIFDHDDLGGDDHIGGCSLPDLSFLEEGDGRYEDWEQVFAKDGDEAGELLMRISCQFSEEDAVREAFNRIDDDGSGELDVDEVGELMLQIGRDLKESLPRRLWSGCVAPLKWTLKCCRCTKFLSCCFPKRLTPLEKMMEEIDEDGSGLVEFDEYWEWWMKGVTKIRWPWRMALLCGGLGAGPVVTAWQYWHRSHLLDVVERAGRAAFNKIDDDGSGELDREEIGLLAKDLGKALDKESLDAMMEEIDADGSGLVDYEEFFAWYAAGVDNTGMDAEQQREIHERAEDVSTVNLLVIGMETLPISLYHLYIGLQFNCFDHIDFFEANEGDTELDDFASGLSMSVTATVFIGFVSASCGWVSAEMVRSEDYIVFSRHGIWTFIFRFAEMSSRVLTLAAFGCAWRGWTFLLLFIDLLLITALNLCQRLSPATLDDPEGQHIPFRAELFFGAVSTIAYVGSPTQGLSCLCQQGAIVGVTAYYSLRVVEMGVMALLWLTRAHELVTFHEADQRTCFDQVYLTGTAGFFSVVLAAAVPIVWYTDYRNPKHGESVVEGAQGPSMGDEEDLWGKNDWESSSGSGSDSEASPTVRPRSVLVSRGSRKSRQSRGLSRGASSVGFNETMSSIGWVGVDATDDPTLPQRRRLPAQLSSSDEEEDEDENAEFVPLTQEEMDKIPEHGFQRAIVAVMNDPNVPSKHKSRRIQQLVTQRNLVSAEKKRAAHARKQTAGVLRKWGNPQLREQCTMLGVAVEGRDGQAELIEKILGTGFEIDPEAIQAAEEAMERAKQEAREREEEEKRGILAARQKEMAEMKAELAKQNEAKQGDSSPTASGPAARMGRMRRASVVMLELE